MTEVRHNAVSTVWFAVDADLLTRVRKTSTVLGLVLSVPFATYFGLMAAAGWIVGFAWSIVNLLAIARLVSRILADGPRDKRAIVLALAVKFPALYAIGLLALAVAKLPPLWLVAGFTWPLFVAVMKAAGRMYLGLDETVRRSRQGI